MTPSLLTSIFCNYTKLRAFNVTQQQFNVMFTLTDIILGGGQLAGGVWREHTDLRLASQTVDGEEMHTFIVGHREMN